MTLIVNLIQNNNRQDGTIDDIVDFKLNSPLSAGTNAFFGILEEGEGDQYLYRRQQKEDLHCSRL
jgi:hypothetical protein